MIDSKFSTSRYIFDANSKKLRQLNQCLKVDVNTIRLCIRFHVLITKICMKLRK